MRQGINSIAIVLIMTIVLFFIPDRIAQAANTTVVISVSIGGGVAVGMVGWFIHLTYSQRVARAYLQPHTLSAQSGRQGEVLSLDGSHLEWNRKERVFPFAPGLMAAENMPPEQTTFIRLVELPW